MPAAQASFTSRDADRILNTVDAVLLSSRGSALFTEPLLGALEARVRQKGFDRSPRPQGTCDPAERESQVARQNWGWFQGEVPSPQWTWTNWNACPSFVNNQ